MEEKKPKDNDSIPTIVRKSNQENNKKNSKFKRFRPIIIASILAIATGSVLGIIMINLFTTIEDNVGTASKSEVVANNVDEKDNGKNQAENVKSTSLNAWYAYVIQGGVFSNLANAEDLANQFSNAGFPSVVWERDNQYFVLLGIASTEDAAASTAVEITQSGHEVIVKSWETAGKSIPLTKKEIEWVESFESQWQSSVQAVNDGGVFPKQGWEELLTNIPAGENLSSLSEKLQAVLDEQKGTSKLNNQQFILEIWLLYEEKLI